MVAAAGELPTVEELRGLPELCVVDLDLVAHKGEHGPHPESLADLEHPDEPGCALDPFSGETLRFRREGDGLVLGSFGRDLDDDGGPSHTQTREDDDYHIVFRCER